MTMCKRHSARRDLFGSGASLLLLTAAAAGQAKADELDGALLAACASFQRAEARLDYLNEAGDHPAGVVLDDELTQANAAWFAAIEAVAEQPARTPEGLKAKAAAARAAHARFLDEVVCGDDTGGPELVRSVLNDLLGRA